MAFDVARMKSGWSERRKRFSASYRIPYCEPCGPGVDERLEIPTSSKRGSSEILPGSSSVVVETTIDEKVA